MPYQVPQNINPNKIFLVNFSDLQGRWDPKMSLFQKESKTFKYRVASLKDFLSKDPQYGAGESGIERTGISEPRYIRITDINDDGTLNDSLGATAQNIEEKYFLKENDILIARSGATVGKAYIHKNVFPYQCFFAGYLIRFVVSHYLLPDYFFVYTQLQVYKNWINAVQRPSGQPNINAEEYKSLPIPIPPKEIQQQIIDYYNSAYKSKLEKHQQAETLLQSIDDYLLGELGITLPNTNAQSLNDRIFTVNYSEVCGGRLDPKGVLFLGEHAKSTKYSNIQLKQIATIKKGEAITSENVDKNGHYPVIAGGQASPYNHNIYNYDGDVITVSASGAYSGYVWYHNYPIFASDCSVIYSKDDRFTTKYIFEVLKAQQSQIYLLQQGAGQPHVYPDDLGKLWIPIIDKTKQQEIVDHITKIRQQAKQLQVEGDGDLKKAKEEVERMILN